MNFSADQTKNIMSVLATILHLSNVAFTTQGGAQVRAYDAACGN